MSEINSISISDLFWIRFESHCINWGFKGLPQHVHFTISFSPKSPDINFHITKNNGTNNDKPKIEILRIDKQLLEEDANKLGMRLLFKSLEEISFSDTESSFFLPFGDSDSATSKLVQNKLQEKFNDNMQMKGKKKLKIVGELESKFQAFATDEELLETLQDDIVPVQDIPLENVQGGILIIDNKEIQAIRIFDKFYKIKILSPNELFSIFLNPEVYNQLLPMIKKAIIRVKNSNSWAETQPYNNSIRLIRSSKELNN